MDYEVIGGIATSVALFSFITWIILRFTSSPGLRAWSFTVVFLLSYPVCFGLVALAHDTGLVYPGSQDPVTWRLFIGATVIGSPLLVWMGVRVAVAVWRRPRGLIWIMSSVVVILLVFGYGRYSAVPWRTLDYQAWRTEHPTWGVGAADDPAANRFLVFARANFDYLVSRDAPLQRLRFYDFHRENSDTVYLRFLDKDGHSALIYCYSTPEKKFLWKAWWPIHES